MSESARLPASELVGADGLGVHRALRVRLHRLARSLAGAHIRIMRAAALVAAALAAAAAAALTTGDDTERLPQLRRWTEDNGGWLS
jgi:hypothetical protein